MEGSVPPGFPGAMISSSYIDLKEYRQFLIEILMKYDIQPICMEADVPCVGQGVIATSLNFLSKSHAYIGIISHRYGAQKVTEHLNPNGCSLTELEYDEAVKLNLPILIFMMSREHKVLPSDLEKTRKGKKKLEDFRRKVLEMSNGDSRVYKDFNDLESFKVEALLAIGKLSAHLKHAMPLPAPPRPPVPGVVREYETVAACPAQPAHQNPGRSHATGRIGSLAAQPQSQAHSQPQTLSEHSLQEEKVNKASEKTEEKKPPTERDKRQERDQEKRNNNQIIIRGSIAIAIVAMSVISFYILNFPDVKMEDKSPVDTEYYKEFGGCALEAEQYMAKLDKKYSPEVKAAWSSLPCTSTPCSPVGDIVARPEECARYAVGLIQSVEIDEYDKMKLIDALANPDGNIMHDVDNVFGYRLGRDDRNIMMSVLCQAIRKECER